MLHSYQWLILHPRENHTLGGSWSSYDIRNNQSETFHISVTYLYLIYRRLSYIL